MTLNEGLVLALFFMALFFFGPILLEHARGTKQLRYRGHLVKHLADYWFGFVKEMTRGTLALGGVALGIVAIVVLLSWLLR